MSTMILKTGYLSVFAMTLCVSMNTAAQAQHGDIALFNDGGKVGVGLVDETVMPEIFDPSARVFETILGPQSLTALPTMPPTFISPFDYTSDEPGFDAEDGEFGAFEAIDLTPVSLSYWDGSGSVAFGPAAGVTFGLDDSALETDMDGGFHGHTYFGLSGVSVPNGVYLGEFVVDIGGLDTSDSLFFVMLKDDLIDTAQDLEDVEEALEAFEEGDMNAFSNAGLPDFSFFEEAAEFAEAQVPEPSSALIALFAVTAVAGSRRR